MKYILAFFATFVFVYLVFSFYNLSIYAGSWQDASRFLFCVIGPVVSIFPPVFIYILQPEPDERKKFIPLKRDPKTGRFLKRKYERTK